MATNRTETSKTKEGVGLGAGLSYPMLTRGNYTAWAIKMKVFMQAHGVWTAIDSKTTDPAVEERTEKIALAAIYQGIPEDILLSISEKSTAKEAWGAIKTMCLGADKVKKAKVQTLKADFESLRMKDNEKLDDFCIKLNGLVANIRVLGETVEETYVVKKLLRAVPTKFLQIASTIEQFGDLEKMSVEEAVGSLKAHEERLKGQGDSTGGQQLLLTEEEWLKTEKEEGQLLLTKEEWQRRSKTKNNAGDYRAGREGFRGGGRDKSKIRCFNCLAYGHYASECRKPKKDKEQRLEANITQAQDDEPALLMVKAQGDKVLLNEENVKPRLQMTESKNGGSNVWYLDNGASNHMTGERSKFTELNEKVTGQVRFGDGSTVDIKGKGAILFRCKNGEERLFKEVYYIPSLCNNILSLGQFSEEGNRVVMHGEYLWVYDKGEKLLMKVKRSCNRLYKILVETVDSKCLMSKTDEEAWLWHTRLGHVNFQALNLMSRNSMVEGVPKVIQPKDLCPGCMMSKQSRKSFPAQSRFRASHALELIHGDLCGPITPETSGGNRYFLLLVDDYSRAMWAYLLKTKDEAFEAFKKFRMQVEKGTELKIKSFRTDRGGEFCSQQFISYCEDSGIYRQYTAPYTPQQNGVVERRNRTIVAMIRSLLKTMNLPSVLWGEALRHAVYILNRLPTRALTEMTPYEAWTGRKPNLEYLKVFGCVSYMKIPSVQTAKLDDRSKMVVNLGKEPGTKAYRLYDPVLHKVHVSRDVTFDEKQSWDWATPSHDTHTEGANGPFTVFGYEQTDVNEQVSSSGENQFEGGAQTNTTAQDSDEPQTPVSTQFQSSAGSTNGNDGEESSEQPLRFRSLRDVYDETEPIEISDELLFMGVDEPVNYTQASKKREWRIAMEQELEAIEKNETWSLTELPPGKKAIDLKWVYKLKKDTEGKVVKHKARIVAKGYVQQYGVDFEEIFAPVTRLETVRLLLALSAKNGWTVHHLDVKSAFLNGELKEEVFVSQPEGFEKPGKEHMVYRLSKALYGLRQAPRAWYSKLRKCLENMGLVRCPYEHAVYTKREAGEVLIVAVYVDDLLVTGTNEVVTAEFKKQMAATFEMSDLGRLSYYLGLEVNQQNGYVELKQEAYAKRVLEKAGMESCNPTRFPMDPKAVITKDEGGTAVNATEYKSIIGGLRYLVHTRPDIAFAVGIISRYMEKPTELHLNAAKRILRYIRGTVSYGLIYSETSANNAITGFSDSDLGGNVEDRKSTSGVVFYLNESVITWVSQKQKCVALSSCEAEFMAATAAACQGIWLRNLLGAVTGRKLGAVTLYVDNKSAIDLAKNPVFHGRSKHIDIRYHFIRECVERGEIIIKHVRTEEQRADVLTKALSIVKFERMRRLLGVNNLNKDD